MIYENNINVTIAAYSAGGDGAISEPVWGGIGGNIADQHDLQEQLGGMTLLSLTQAEYDAIVTPDLTTLYFIYD